MLCVVRVVTNVEQRALLECEEDFVYCVHACYAFLAPALVWVRSLACFSTDKIGEYETRGNMVEVEGRRTKLS